MSNVPKELNNMLQGIMSTAAHAVRDGQYARLGVMPTDGLKRNNEIMRAQDKFTPEFYTCGKLTSNLLKLMDNPDLKALKTAVESNLSKEDMEVAKACKGVYDVIADGISAQNRLVGRFRMNDDAMAFDKKGRSANDKGILDDMAKLCHMHGMERQFVGKQLPLDAKCNYSSFPDFATRTNTQLANTSTIDNYVEQLRGMNKNERLAAIKNPQELGNLFQNSMRAVREMYLQQNQPQQHSFTLASAPKQMQQPQPAPQQAMGGPGGG